MSTLAYVGDFCSNTDCPDHGKTDAGNIIKFGKSRQNKQRYRCNSCGQTFNENHGTIFYRKRKSEKDIIEVLSLLAEGSRISSISRTKGFKEDTILGWLRETAQHAEAIEEILLEDYAIERAQIDGLWSYVANKGQKNTMPKPTRRASSGARPCSISTPECA